MSARRGSMFSKTTEYALSALVCLASSTGAAMSSARIAEMTGVPSSYLSKVLQALTRAKIVRSQRGPSGGFALAREASSVSALEVARVVEGWEDAPDPDVHAPMACRVHRFLDEMAADALSIMASTTLADLVSRETTRVATD